MNNQEYSKKDIYIIATSDMHLNIMGYDYSRSIDDGLGCVSRLYSYVNGLRSEGKEVILIDAGDAFLGDEIYNRVFAEDTTVVNPMFRLMNALKYDAMTLGNHDFDLGLNYLEHCIDCMEFPVLCANIKRGGKAVTGLEYTIVSRLGIKVGIIGVTTPFTKITAAGNEGIDKLEFLSPIDVLADIIPKIRENVDVLIVSSHMGGDGEFDLLNNTDSSLYLADSFPEIDILQMGHTHMHKVGRKNGVLYAENKDKAREAICFKLSLDSSRQIITKEAEIVDISAFEPAGWIEDDLDVKRLHDIIKYQVATGYERKDTSAIIGSALDDFLKEKSFLGAAYARVCPSAVSQLIAKAILDNVDAQIVAANLPDPYFNLKKGEIREGDIKKLYKFDNYIYVLNVDKDQLLGYLEWSAGCYKTYAAGDALIEFEEEYQDYMHDIFYGIDYKIDISKPSGNRICDLSLNGRALDDDEKLRLAVGNYRYNTNLKGMNIIGNDVVMTSEITVSEMIINYIKKRGTISPDVEKNWCVIS